MPNGPQHETHLLDVTAGSATAAAAQSHTARKAQTMFHWPVLASVVFTTVVFLVVAVFLRDLRQPAIYEYMIGSSGSVPVIQLLITFLFFWAIAVLVDRRHRIEREFRGFETGLDVLHVHGADERVISAAQVDTILRSIEAKTQAEQNLIVVRRIERSMRRFKNTNTVTEIDTVLHEMSEIDRIDSDSSYIGVRFAALIVPILGFIGTVYGISQAILGFTDVLQGAADFSSLKPALRGVVSNMGLAFGVTLMALLGSGIILLVSSIVQHREDDLYTACDRFCVDNIITKIRLVSETNKVLEAQREMLNSALVVVKNQATRITDAVQGVQDAVLGKSKDEAGPASDEKAESDIQQ
jgi:hypothetical protein